MQSHQLLGQLSALHQMMGHLLMSVPEEDAYRRFHSALPPLAWLLGRSVYLEPTGCARLYSKTLI